LSEYPKEIKSRQTFQYGNKTVEYILIQSKRRKTCEVIVDKAEITLRAPLNKPVKEIEQILTNKIKWISQKQREMQNEKPGIIKPSFEEKPTLSCLGKNYNLKIIYIPDKLEKRIEFDNDIFTIYSSKRDLALDNMIRSLYNDWLNSKADLFFKEKVTQYSKIINVIPNQIRIKNLKNRWGSITKNKTVNLNVNLLKAPEDIIDYLIIHELCHLKIKGHSYQFWDYLKQFVPDYKQKVEWLRRNADSLLI